MLCTKNSNVFFRVTEKQQLPLLTKNKTKQKSSVINIMRFYTLCSCMLVLGLQGSLANLLGLGPARSALACVASEVGLNFWIARGYSCPEARRHVVRCTLGICCPPYFFPIFTILIWKVRLICIIYTSIHQFM